MERPIQSKRYSKHRPALVPQFAENYVHASALSTWYAFVPAPGFCRQEEEDLGFVFEGGPGRTPLRLAYGSISR
jgi:hypothetical protein